MVGSIHSLTSAGLETAINRLIALDPVASQALADIHGKVVCLEFSGLNSRYYLIPEPGRLQVLSHHEGEPDCLIRGSPMALLRMNGRREGSSQLFSGEVSITGDTELAHRIAKILATFEIDWEEQLSRLTGDILAHQAGDLVRQAGAWGRDRFKTLTLNGGEYLQEESQLLPTRIEIEEFLTGVDTLRDDTERLQARIVRLSQSLEDGT